MPANRHRSLALVALIPREPQAHERLGDPALNALLTHLTARLVVDVALTDGGRSGGDALALSVEQVLPEGQVATAGGGGEAGFALLRVTINRSPWLNSCHSTLKRWIQVASASPGATGCGADELLLPSNFPDVG
jgi:hypothetical protein